MTINIYKMTHVTIPESILEQISALGNLKQKEFLNEAEQKIAMREANILICSGGTKVSAKMLDRMPNLQMIANFGEGYDGIDIYEVSKRNILISHTPNISNDDVADTAIALLLNTTRRFVYAQKFIENGLWENSKFSLSRSLHSLKVGIVGLGKIGIEIANRLQAFKTEIAYYSRADKRKSYKYFDNVEDLATWADALIVTITATPDTFHFIDEKVLKALGRGYLINVSRGSTVDTQALIDFIQGGALAGVGLDVFEDEPHVPYDLKNVANVVITPHIASATVQTRTKMGELMLSNIRAFLDDKPLLTNVPGTLEKRDSSRN